MHFVFSRLHKFPENLGAISDEQGERFHQAFMTTEGRYHGRGPTICYQTTVGTLNVIVREISTNARVISVNFCPDTGACK